MSFYAQGLGANIRILENDLRSQKEPFPDPSKKQIDLSQTYARSPGKGLSFISVRSYLYEINVLQADL